MRGAWSSPGLSNRDLGLAGTWAGRDLGLASDGDRCERFTGLFGIAFGAFRAWRPGTAEDFYLPGILLTFGQAAVLLLEARCAGPATATSRKPTPASR